MYGPCKKRTWINNTVMVSAEKTGNTSIGTTFIEKLQMKWRNVFVYY